MLQRSTNGDAYLPDGTVEWPEPRPPRSTGRALVFFLLIFFALQWGWESLRGSWVERLVVHQATVAPAATLIRTLTPEIPARASGSSIKAPGGGLNILNGCEGTEVMFLMIAAIFAARLPWRLGLAGLGLGLLWVFILNQARILTLFYAFRGNREWFDLLHTAILPAILVALALAYFHGLIHLANRRHLS